MEQEEGDGARSRREQDEGENRREKTQRHREDVAAGVVPPDFAIQKAIAQSEAFTGLLVETNPLIATFQAKLAVATEISDAAAAAFRSSMVI